jgi:hypothetical protein
VQQRCALLLVAQKALQYCMKCDCVAMSCNSSVCDAECVMYRSACITSSSSCPACAVCSVLETGWCNVSSDVSCIRPVSGCMLRSGLQNVA